MSASEVVAAVTAAIFVRFALVRCGRAAGLLREKPISRPSRSRESRTLHFLVALWLQLSLPASALAQSPIDAHFDSDSEGFAYQDDAFRATSQPSYASGSHSASGGFSGGGLVLQLGGVDDATIDDMSGAWAIDFSLGEAVELELAFRYELTQSPDYESFEYSQVMVSLDGTPLAGAGADYVVAIQRALPSAFPAALPDGSEPVEHYA